MNLSILNKKNLSKFLFLAIIALAVPLTVGLSLNQQNTQSKAAVGVACDNGLTCTTCNPITSNSCYANARMNCSYTKKLGGGDCDIQTFNNIICRVNNCNNGATCVNKVCVGGSGNTSTPTPTTGNNPTPPTGGGSGIWISRAELLSLPTSGAAWDRLKNAADSSLGSPSISNQDSSHDVLTLAAAIVYARTGDNNYRSKAAGGITSAMNTENGGRVLALARNLVSYVIAADLIGLDSYNASQGQSFRTWLSGVRRESMTECTNLIDCHEKRPNNWGTHAAASRIAADIYLNDKPELDKAAQVFKGWLGDRSAYSGFSYGDTSWQCNSSQPVGINPKGCTKSGNNIDGVLPDDQRRGGGFTWPAPKENYVYEGMQGALVAAVLLHRAGYDALNWSDKAVLRAYQWLYNVNNFPATGDDAWQMYVVNHYYNTNFSTSTASVGKNMGWTDWTHQ